MRKLKVTIAPNGKTSIEAIGYNGVGCKAATNSLAKAIGAVGGDGTEKPEFHQLPDVEIENEQELDG